MNPYSNTYKTQQIQTASQEQILILLYEGAIRFIKQAKAAYEDKDIEKFHNNLIKTQRIIMEFMTTLDMDLGGEMAKNLFSLYEYLHYRLVQANLKKDVNMLNEVLHHLEELKETWENAIRMSKKPEKDNNLMYHDNEEEERAYIA